MGGQEASGAMEKKVKRREGAPGGGLSSLSSSFRLSPGCPERWLKQFRFGPEMMCGVCAGLGARMSDVGLGSHLNSLSVKLSLIVLGYFLLGKVGEGRPISNELGHALRVAIEVVQSMNGKASKIRG